MAQLIQPFNAHNVDPSQGAGSLPIGKHPVIIEASDVKGTKANDGGLVEFRLKIIDGPNAGVSGAYRLNLYHSNPQTVEIANRQLSALCHVTGVFMLQDTSALHNIPFMVEVGSQKPTLEQAELIKQGQNVTLYTEVKRVFDINGNEPGKQGQGQGAAQTQGAAGAWGGQQQGQQQNNGGGQGGNPGGGWGQNQSQQGQQGQQGQGGFTPPADQGQQGQPPANGGGAWGGQDQGQGQGGNPGGFQPPQGQNQGNGQGQGGGWEQQQNSGGAAPWGQR